MTTTPTPPARRTPLQMTDIVVGVLLTIIAAMIGLIFLAYINQLGALQSECEGITADGLRCAPAFLSAMTIVGTGIVVFAWFLAVGFLIMRVIQRRIVFFLPLIAVAVMIAGFWIVLGLVGTQYVPVG